MTNSGDVEAAVRGFFASNFKKITGGLQRLEDGIMVLLFAVMVAATFGQIVNRNIIMYPIVWLEELARYSMIYLTMFATEAGLRDGTQISADMLTSQLHGFLKKMVGIIGSAILTVFAIIIFIYTIPVIKNQLYSGQITPGLRIPMVIPYFALFIGFGLIAVTQTINLFFLLTIAKGIRKGEV
jgi:TRAP-type C4-dicarboxylate transport system permease small subunit